MVGCLAGGLSAAMAGGIKDSLGLTAAYQLAAVVLILGAISLHWIPRPSSARTE